MGNSKKPQMSNNLIKDLLICLVSFTRYQPLKKRFDGAATDIWFFCDFVSLTISRGFCWLS